jgi:hypothetical protein
MSTRGLFPANYNNINVLKDITLSGAPGAPFAFMNGVGQLTDGTFAVTWESR